MATSSRASSSPSAGRSERSATDVVIATVLVAACILLALSVSAGKKVLNGGSDDKWFHDPEAANLELMPVEEALVQ